ncbi:MAG TPA: ACP S-malonyltransferase [Candidatus Kapabacteria bacterium]|nr:ACP S-malonyltransferase [Candidatus Kapabacteria bacterium]
MINGGLMKTALLCSGQGSQYVGMMKDLFDNSNKAKEIIQKADEILDFSLSEICFNGPMDVLKQTRFTQPAIFLHSAVLYELLKDKLEFDAVAGHSVGEYAALYIAGVIEFEDALRLVSLRGQLMYSAGEELPGTMFAVLNLDDDKVVEVCNKLNQNDEGAVVVAANFNSPGQVVVSGSRDFLRNNINAFKEAGAKLVKELVVSGAFHSPLMKPAQLELEKAINTIEFKNSKVPVYSNVYAKPLTNADEIKNALIAQLTAPVLWTQSLRQMFSDGITRFVELGPGQVLQGLVKRTLENIEILGYDKFDDLQK